MKSTIASGARALIRRGEWLTVLVNTLESNFDYRNYLESAWRRIIIDGCCNACARVQGGGFFPHTRLTRLLSTRADKLILLLSNPRDDSACSSCLVMSPLDPAGVSDPDDCTPENCRDNGGVVRCFKKDIYDQMQGDFGRHATRKVMDVAARNRSS